MIHIDRSEGGPARGERGGSSDEMMKISADGIANAMIDRYGTLCVKRRTGGETRWE